jgi:hypothetical protein
MPINSRAKGARAERDLANAFKELFGWTARRTQQFCGQAGDSDVVIEELPEVFVESKMVESLSIVPTMRKAVEQCKGKLPVICHRKKQTEWLCTIRLTDLERFARMICQGGSLSSAPRVESDTTPDTNAST